MNKHFRIALLVTGLVGAGVALAVAPDDGEEPPPPKLNECSPGFWKNHQEFWATQYCASTGCVTAVLTELTSQGNGSGDRRHIAAGALNTWADSYYGATICTE
jgi:rhodanese-related sulfurtransferase